MIKMAAINGCLSLLYDIDERALHNYKLKNYAIMKTLDEFHEQASQLVTKLFQEYADENEVGLQLTFISFEDEADTQPESHKQSLNNSTV